ncbi:MAG: hypothetical protein VX705_06300 [Verrucomicrobiota bacterium]|nr:hypothetical protein [Verrucomicrobiota bacterium]
MKLIAGRSIPAFLALTLFAGCGGDDTAGGEVFEKGIQVITISDLQGIVSVEPNFDGAIADVYEGDIGFWYYKGQPYTGWAIERYDNGRLKHKEFLQTGLQHGLTRDWYENGQLSVEINWHHGLPDGLEVMWHQNGNVHVVNYWQRGMVLIKKAWNESGVPMKIEGWNEDGTPEAASGGSNK